MKICCLVIVEDKKNNKLLMVENLRGINKGYVNFPGGKKEFDETIEHSQIRETLEETGITPLNSKTIGKIKYLPVDIEMYIFYCDKFKGNIKSNKNETKTFWVNKNNIPFNKMRSSDIEWVDDALAGKYINKKIIYKENDEYEIQDIFDNIEKYKKKYNMFLKLKYLKNKDHTK